MKSVCRCAYCHTMLGNTKDHILPKSFIASVNYYIVNNDTETRCYRINPTGEGTNIVPACKWCNLEKGNTLWFPTVSNVYTIFKWFTLEQIVDYIEFLYDNKESIEEYLKKYPTEYKGNSLGEFKEFLYIYEKGYFDRIDSIMKVLHL